MKSYTVVIIGGGPAGSSCAIALSRLGLKDILIIESGDYSIFRIGESIPPDSNRIFKQLGIYEAFTAEGHEPCYGNCSYWGDSRRGYNDTILSPYGHGWHLDRNRFNFFLSKQAQKKGVKVLRNYSFQYSETLDNGGFKLMCTNENQTAVSLNSDFVVDATGSRSLFALQQGSFKLETESIICLALRFSTADKRAHISKLTHIETAEYGWWYAARISDDTLLVGLYTDKHTLKQKEIQKIDIWLNLLKETPNTSKLIAHTKIIDDKLKGFLAPSFCLDKISGDNWLAIGDAASAYDPITSRGIVKSMTNALYSAEAINNHFNGVEGAITEFEEDVKTDYNYYLEIRHHYYSQEMRWPNSSFWNKYQEMPVIQ